MAMVQNSVKTTAIWRYLTCPFRGPPKQEAGLNYACFACRVLDTAAAMFQAARESEGAKGQTSPMNRKCCPPEETGPPPQKKATNTRNKQTNNNNQG